MTRYDIPTPAAERTGEKTTVGTTAYGGRTYTFDQVIIDGREHLLAADGKVFTRCGRCSGTGTKPEFGMIYEGQCFECAGSGIGAKGKTGGRYASVEHAQKAARARLVAEARRERKQAEKEAAADAEWDAWYAANPELAARIVAAAAEDDADWTAWATARFGFVPGGADGALYRSDYFRSAMADKYGPVADLITRVAERWVAGPLSEKQAAWVARAMDEADAKAQADAEKRAGQRHAGTVGAKLTVTGTVALSMTVETQFGLSRLVVIEGTGDDAGVTVKLFGSGRTLWDTERDQVVTVTGAVKAHEEYQGTPQTVLTRAKVEVLEGAAS